MITIQEKLEFLKYLSQTHRQQFDERRRYEIKIVFSIITFYILTVSAIYTKGINIELIKYRFNTIIFVAIAIALVIDIIAIIFMGKIHRSNHIELRFAESTEDCIEKMLNSGKNEKYESFDIKNFKWFECENCQRKFLMLSLECSMIFVFSVVAILLIFLKFLPIHTCYWWALGISP